MRHKHRGKKKLMSGILEKARVSDIGAKLKWASSMLGTKHEVSFENLTFDQYFLGESQILSHPKICEIQRKAQ